MSTLRRAITIRRLDHPYTRRSKYKKKGYVKSIPNHKISKFEMGDKTKIYEYRVRLVSKDTYQLRHNAIESARLVVNRKLQTALAGNYFLRVCIYPHHIIRENKMMGGAHADRIQSGMAHSFGKPTGVAAQIKKGKDLFNAWVNAADLEKAKAALKSANPRLPGRSLVVIEKSSKVLN